MNLFSGTFKKITLLLVLTGVTLPVSAEFDRRWYLGIGAGVSMIEPDPADSGYVVEENSDSGAKVYVGWDYSERWSFEGYFANLGEAELEQAEGEVLNPPNGNVSYQTYGATALFNLLNTQGDAGRSDRTGISLFGKVGGGILDTDSEDLTITQLEDLHLMLGLGLEYAFESGLGLRAEYEAYDTDAHLGSLSLLWRFGRDGGSSATAAAAAATATQSSSTIELPQVVEPSTPETESETVPLVSKNSQSGVASIDNDSDGVFDALDACPDTPFNVAVDNNGCPLFDRRLEGVNFLSGSATLTDSAQAALDKLADDLNNTPSVRIAVMAHTDNQGPAIGNLELSKKRAISVARYLVSRGVAGNRIQPEAYGESQPLVSNATAEGRRQNRRVEFRTLQ